MPFKIPCPANNTCMRSIDKIFSYFVFYIILSLSFFFHWYVMYTYYTEIDHSAINFNDKLMIHLWPTVRRRAREEHCTQHKNVHTQIHDAAVVARWHWQWQVYSSPIFTWSGWALGWWCSIRVSSLRSKLFMAPAPPHKNREMPTAHGEYGNTRRCESSREWEKPETQAHTLAATTTSGAEKGIGKLWNTSQRNSNRVWGKQENHCKHIKTCKPPSPHPYPQRMWEKANLCPCPLSFPVFPPYLSFVLYSLCLVSLPFFAAAAAAVGWVFFYCCCQPPFGAVLRLPPPNDGRLFRDEWWKLKMK
jgi:hypothetical protein